MKDYEKYIDVGDAVKILCHDCIRYVFPTTAEPTTEFIKLRNAINLLQLYPSADVAPVRHGRWEKNDDYTCSLCGYRMVIGDGAYNYCPNCGARMDKDGDALIDELGISDEDIIFEGMLEDAPTIDAVPRWIPCEERLPKDLEVVNITWINHRPMTYYADIKDKPFTATAIHYRDKWWWYSPICEDLLAECGESECDEMDSDIEVTAWMPLPEPYKGERKDDE